MTMVWRGALLVLPWVLACTTGDDSAADVTCKRDPPLGWDNFAKGYTSQHCLGCHSVLLPDYRREEAPLGVNFNTYRDLLKNLDGVEQYATGADPKMPPAGGPTADEIALFTEFLDCTAKPDRDALEKQGEL